MGKRKAANALSDELVSLIRKLSLEGLSTKEVAKKVGVNQSTVYRYVGGKFIRNVITKEQIKIIHGLFFNMMHKSDISKQTNIPIQFVRYHTRGLIRDEEKVTNEYRKIKRLTSTPSPLPPKKRKTEVRKEDTEDMRKFSRKDPLAGRVKVEIKPGLWAYIKNDERFEERLERQKELHCQQ